MVENIVDKKTISESDNETASDVKFQQLKGDIR